MLRAIYHRVDEAWIARQPVLAVGYLFQYTPFGWPLMKAVGPKRAMALKQGRSGYSGVLQASIENNSKAD